MTSAKVIYLGIKGSVIALNSTTGEQLWATELKGSEFVNVVLDENNLYAAARGEMFCLDPQTGNIRWHNPLKGYGWGLICIAGDGLSQNNSVMAAEKHSRDQQAALSSNSSTAATA